VPRLQNLAMTFLQMGDGLIEGGGENAMRRKMTTPVRPATTAALLAPRGSRCLRPCFPGR
jgi:hypothetical protein